MNLNEFQEKCLETATFSEEQKVDEVISAIKSSVIMQETMPTDKDGNFSRVLGFQEDNETKEKVLQLIEDIQKMQRLFYINSGLVGEAGEFSEKIKKVYRNQAGRIYTEIEKQKLIEAFPDEKKHQKLITNIDLMFEVLDVLWYAMVMLNELGFEADFACEMLIAKLAERMKNNTIKSSGDKNSER